MFTKHNDIFNLVVSFIVFPKVCYVKMRTDNIASLPDLILSVSILNDHCLCCPLCTMSATCTSCTIVHVYICTLHFVFLFSVFSLNGVPSCASKRLLTGILRGEWKFKGFVISDDDALEHIVNGHHYVPTYVEAAAAAVKAGCNLELTGDSSGWVFSNLLQVVT